MVETNPEASSTQVEPCCWKFRSYHMNSQVDTVRQVSKKFSSFPDLFFPLYLSLLRFLLSNIATNATIRDVPKTDVAKLTPSFI